MVQGQRVLILMDNITAMVDINRQEAVQPGA